MPIKIPQLPSIPAGTISGQTSIPVSKTTSDPKTYKMTLDQTLTWLANNGGGGTGYQGYQGAPGVIGASGYQGGIGFSGYQGPQGSIGAQGTTGTPGSALGIPGRDSYGIQLVASSYVFQASSSATVSSLTATPYNPTSITLYAVPQNLTATATFAGKLYDINSNYIGDPTFGGSGNTRTLTNTQFGSAYSCTVTASIVSGSNTYFDITTITRLQDSTDTLQGTLSNPAIVLAAGNDGTLDPGEQSKATGLFQVYYGLKELTTGVTYSVVSENATSVISTGSSSAVNVSIGASTGIYTLDSIDPNVLGATATLRAQAYGISIDKTLTITKSRQGTTGSAGSAQAVFLTADTQVFNFDNTGTPSPSSQTANFNATLSQLSGFVQWDGVQYYDDGTFSTASSLLSTSGNRAILTVTKFASAVSVGKTVQSFVVSATHVASGLSDAVRVVKVTSGGQGFTTFLTNQSHTVGADSTGAVTSLAGANGYFRIYQGAELLNNQYITYSISSITAGLGAYILNYPSASAGYYALTAFDASLTNGNVVLSAVYSPIGGTPVSFLQTFSVAKSKTGPVGDTGPGIVYRGNYKTDETYYRTASRADVVILSSTGLYYLATETGLGSVLGTPGTPGAKWASFGAYFTSIATGLLLAEDATILKTLVMGYQTAPEVITGRGIIRSYGTSDWNPGESPQDGFWLGMDSDNYAKFRVGSTSNNLIWDGSRLTLSYGNSGILLYSGSSATDMYLSMGQGTPAFNNTGIWLGREGNSSTGKYKLSLKNASNGRSFAWTGDELIINGATSNLQASGTIYLNKNNPRDFVNTGFWLGASAIGGNTKAFFNVGSPDSYLTYDQLSAEANLPAVKIKGAEAVDGIYISSGIGLRRTTDTGSFTITGGTDNGAQHGAQIDLIGNNYTGSGSGGQLVLQAGTGAQSTIALHTNNSHTAAGGSIVGVQRLVVYSDGLVSVNRSLSLSGTGSNTYTTKAGSLFVGGNVGIGVEPENSGTGILGDTSGATGNVKIQGTLSINGGNTVGSNSYGDRTVSNSAPTTTSGYTDGDIWLVV